MIKTSKNFENPHFGSIFAYFAHFKKNTNLPQKMRFSRFRAAMILQLHLQYLENSMNGFQEKSITDGRKKRQ